MEADGSHGALDNKCEGNDSEKKGDSGPVVYQLVRVEGDGTLVPATEDEVLQFEHILHDEKADIPCIEDVRREEDLFSNDCMLLKKSDSEDESSKLETVAAGTEMLCAGIEESRLQFPLNCTVVHDQHPDKLHSEHGGNSITHQANTSTGTTKSAALNDSFIAEKDNTDACSKPADDSCTRKTDSRITTFMPDFSILRGEVCLDDLTIRELQETFRATFGCQTTVKDKIWLKRRITMGLTNSFDVPSSGCVVKDNKIFDKDGKQVIPNTKETPEVELQAISLARHQVINPVNGKNSPSSSYYQSEDMQGSSKRLKRVQMTNDEVQVLVAEQCTIKRIRKPTKRFIEELSDSEAHETPAKLSSPAKRTARDEFLLKPTPFHEVDSFRTIYLTRKDILGGVSLHVPYVSRMRRGRPRKDFISLVNKKSSVVCKGAQTTTAVMLEKDNGNEVNHIRKAFEAPPTANTVKGGHTKAIHNKGVHNASAKPKISRAFMRKHHRAWTLCEVMNLVDGVALYGAGKWSEIRKVAFSSYSYRTSVDLKDKWRNLIKACKTQLPTLEDGGCPRKINPSIIPIPPSILLRVKELNELQSQGGFTAQVKFSGSNNEAVQGKGSGFL